MNGAPGHVVVAGGGIAGLVAAYRLTQSGTEVTLVEPDKLGGKIQTSLIAGRAVDEGADAFLLRQPWAVALCHDLELDGELTSPAARAAEVFVDGRRIPFPSGHVMGVPTDLDALVASGLVSPAGAARAATDLDRPADASDPAGTADPATAPDQAIGAYLRRRLGDEVVTRVVDPLVGGINAGDIDRLSLAAVVPILDQAARSGDPSLIRSCRNLGGGATTDPSAPIFAAPIGGMARLIDGLIGLLPGVELRRGRRVAMLELVGAAAAPTVRVSLDDGQTLDADAVVLACPAHVAGPLLEGIAPRASRTLTDISHSSVSMATMVLPAGSLRPDPAMSGCLVPRDQGTLLTAISYATSKWAHLRDPARDDVILRVSAGRAGDDRHLDLDDDDLVDALLGDLERVVGLRDAPVDVRVSRWPAAFPQYQPGHLDRIDHLEADLASLPVAVAGMALRGVGIPATIHSAERAAAVLGAVWPTRRSLG